MNFIVYNYLLKLEIQMTIAFYFRVVFGMGMSRYQTINKRSVGKSDKP